MQIVVQPVCLHPDVRYRLGGELRGKDLLHVRLPEGARASACHSHTRVVAEIGDEHTHQGEAGRGALAIMYAARLGTWNATAVTSSRACSAVS
jgi:hypothetical protein